MLPAAAYRHALQLHLAAIARAANPMAKYFSRDAYNRCLANARAAHPLAFPHFIN